MLQAEAAAEAAAVAHVGGDPAETPANRLAFTNDAGMFRGKREVARGADSGEAPGSGIAGLFSL